MPKAVESNDVAHQLETMPGCVGSGGWGEALVSPDDEGMDEGIHLLKLCRVLVMRTSIIAAGRVPLIQGDGQKEYSASLASGGCSTRKKYSDMR